MQYNLPERIDSTPEEITEVVPGTKPKTHWSYEEETGRQRTRKID